MTRKYYILEGVTKDNIAVKHGLVDEDASFDETAVAFFDDRHAARMPYIKLAEELGAEAFFDCTYADSFYGFKFKKPLEGDMELLFTKPDRYGTQSLRAKPRYARLRERHAEYKEKLLAASEAYSAHWFIAEEVENLELIGLRTLEVCLVGGKMRRGKSDDSRWAWVSSVEPRTVKFREVTGSELEEYLK